MLNKMVSIRPGTTACIVFIEWMLLSLIEENGLGVVVVGDGDDDAVDDGD